MSDEVRKKRKEGRKEGKKGEKEKEKEKEKEEEEKKRKEKKEKERERNRESLRLGVGFGAAWQRRFLCFLLPSVSCFCFLCFQLSLSLWPLFSASASGSSISSPLFILSSISSVHGSVLTLAAMAFSCRHWVRVMVRLSIW